MVALTHSVFVIMSMVQVKNLYLGKDHVGDAPLLKKIAAGLTTGQLVLIRRIRLFCVSFLFPEFSVVTLLLIWGGWASGALGICVASPTDLVKVRLQSEGKLPPGVPRRYSGAMNAYSTIVKQV
jgi:solute carrier family 25 uncoupling protein 8/9